MFYQNCPKNRFYKLKSNFISFFYKKQGSTLRFFSDFDQNSWFMNFNENMRKKLRVLLPCFLKRKWHKMRFQLVKLTFWKILIKHPKTAV